MDVINKLVALEQEADAFGFRWETTEQIMAQIESECEEVAEHLHEGFEHANRLALQEEIGDLLHAVFSLCVFCRLDPRDTLDKTTLKFERRLHAVKHLARAEGLCDLNGRSFDELMSFWDQAKERVG